MKLSKDTWTIVAILGIAFLVYWIMSKNKKEESGYEKKTCSSCGYPDKIKT